MKKKFPFILLFIITTVNLFSQVTIKERVEIKPQSNQYNSDNPGTAHTIMAIMEWDTTGGTHNYLRARMNMINECTAETLFSDYTYNGHIELSLSSTNEVRYEISTFTEIRDYPYQLTWYPFLFGHSLKVYADGELIYENPAFSNIGSTSILYWRSNLNLRIASYSWNNYQQALCFNERALIRLSDEEDCQPAVWNAGQDIQISIIEGAEHTSFYYGGSELLGDNITFLTDVHGNYFSDYGNIELKYDIEYRDTTIDKLVVLEATVNGLTARDTIIIPKTTGYILNGEIEDGRERIVSEERLTINFWMEAGGLCEGITEPPEGTTFDAEIIQGEEFGGLTDTATAGTTTILTGLETNEGMVSIEYFADGEEPQGDEEIIVKLTSSIPEAEPLYISFLVGLSEIYVTVEPDTLAPGETASIIIKHRIEDGTLEDFPLEQTFEVGMLDGCLLGNIIAVSDTEKYFYEVLQPLIFLADTTEGNIGVVKLRVGLIEEEIIWTSPSRLDDDSVRMKLKEKQADELLTQKRSDDLQRARKETVTGDNPLSACFLPEFWSTSLIDEAIVEVGEECDFPDCSADFLDISVQVVPHNDNYQLSQNTTISLCQNSDPDEYGNSTPTTYERFRKTESGEWKNSWRAVECIKDDKVQFQIFHPTLNEKTPIYADFVFDVCTTKITNQNYHLVYKLEELFNLSNPSKAMHDFCGHFKYPQELENEGYVIEEVIRFHEEGHMNDFIGILGDLKEEYLLKKLREFNFSCNDYNRFFASISEAETEIASKISNYIYEANREYAILSGIAFDDIPEDPVKELAHEKEIQCRDKVKDKTEEYIKRLQFYHKFLKRPLGCNCPKEN